MMNIGRITKPHNQHTTPKKRPAPNLLYPGDDVIRAFAADNNKDINALAKHYNISRETARRWLIKSGALDQKSADDTGSGFSVTRSVMGRAHNGDIEAIKAEIESSTVLEMANRYSVSAGTISGWVFKIGVQAAKICGRCRTKKRAIDMARRSDGFASGICQECEDAQTLRDRDRGREYRERVSKEQQKKEDEFAEALNSADIAVMALRWKMSGQTGYCNIYARGEHDGQDRQD